MRILALLTRFRWRLRNRKTEGNDVLSLSWISSYAMRARDAASKNRRRSRFQK